MRIIFWCCAALCLVSNAWALEPVRIAVDAPAGAPVETSVPFAKAQLRDPSGLTMISPRGTAVLCQFRPAMLWPDGSVRWLYVIFEADAGNGTYKLQEGSRRPGKPLAFAPPRADVILKRHDGKIFRTSLDEANRDTIVEENGPVRASMRYEGKFRATDGQTLFDYVLRWQVYHNRPDCHLTFTWINGTNNSGEQVKDLRVIFPFNFNPSRLVFGAQRGVYDGPFLKDWPVSILQEDYNQYWARTTNPDGRTQNLSTGGANGEQAPGWLYVRNAKKLFGVWVPDFWQEYPNEITVNAREITVGLWPEQAAPHLASKPLLPSTPDGTPYRETRYWPIMPHPYLAFFDVQEMSMDVPQGVAKTQDIWVSTSMDFEKRWWARDIKPHRATVAPDYVTRTGAVPWLAVVDKARFPKIERLFTESFEWLDRHIDYMKCYGKFDYGDFKYMVPSTTYMTHPGTKWGKMGEMPREGYWNNNERDPLRGILNYYLRTGSAKAWQRARIVARHLLDVDMRHFPYAGMYTHGYGHCYAALGRGGEPDHAWLLGLVQWAGMSGDPLVWPLLIRAADHMAQTKRDFLVADTRTAAMQLDMMTQFYLYTGDRKYLEAAHNPAEALLQKQRPDGSWSKYLARPDDEAGFVEHAIMAVADYYEATRDPRFLIVLRKGLRWAFGPDGKSLENPAESPLALHGLAIAGHSTGERQYTEMAQRVLERLATMQNLSPDPIGRGDLNVWADWGVYNGFGVQAQAINTELRIPEGTPKSDVNGRPPQMLNQSRPLAPSSILAYAMDAMSVLEEHRQPQRSAQHAKGN